MTPIWISQVAHVNVWVVVGYSVLQCVAWCCSVLQCVAANSDTSWTCKWCFYSTLTTQSAPGISHVTHVNEPCHTFEWVMSHMWMSHVCHVTESCRTCEWCFQCTATHSHVQLDLFIWELWLIHMCDFHLKILCFYSTLTTQSAPGISHVTHVNESCRTCEWVMSHMWLSHVAHLNGASNALQRAAIHRNALQRTATHCNTL